VPRLVHRHRALAGLETIAPAMSGPQPPILPLSVARTGGYKAVRADASDGSCGVHGYPCQHPGVDAGGAQGTTVRAPEDGQVVLLADGTSAPYVGYGPYLALVLGKSGYYHLLAHLQPGTMTVGLGSKVTAGQALAQTSSANHTHWEVRKKPVPNFAANETNFDNNLDPMDWLSMARGGRVALVIAAVGLAAAAALYLRKRR